MHVERLRRRCHQGAAALVAIGGVLGHAARQYRVDCRRQLGPALARRRNRLLEVGEDRRHLRPVAVWHGSGQAFENETGEAVLVRRAADGVATDLLGRDVGHRSHELAVGRTALRCALGEAEIREITVLALVLAVQQHVARLHVAMDQAAAVSGIECPRQLLGDRDRALGRESSLSPQHGLQISARHVAHGDEQQAVLLARLVDRDDVRVIEARCQARLAQKALAGGLVRDDTGRQHLHGHRTPQPDILCPVHLSVSAPPNQLLGAVARDLRSRERLWIDQSVPPGSRLPDPGHCIKPRRAERVPLGPPG